MIQLGIVTSFCNPSTQEGKAGGLSQVWGQPGLHNSRPGWVQVRSCLKQNKSKENGWSHWHMFIILILQGRKIRSSRATLATYRIWGEHKLCEDLVSKQHHYQHTLVYKWSMEPCATFYSLVIIPVTKIVYKCGRGPSFSESALENPQCGMYPPDPRSIRSTEIDRGGNCLDHVISQVLE